MCQSHDENSAATPAGDAGRYSRDAAESTCQKTEGINDKRKCKITDALMPFAKFGVGLFMTCLNIAARIFIVIPVYSFWLIVFISFEEGLGNINAYFDGVLNTSFAAAVLYIAIYIVMCLMFDLQCRIIHKNLRDIK